MRRSEFQSDNEEDLKFIMETAEIGHLGLVDNNGYPRIIPLDFVAIDKIIYFHGAIEGEKYELMKKAPLATFSIDIPYSYIPSYWQSPRNATPASHFFKSIHIRGRAEILTDKEEKALAMQKMMEKYQPEGKHVPVTATHRLYVNQLDKTGVFKVIPEEITMKIKFGQNIRRDKLEKIIEGLKKRGFKRDLQTIKEIQKYSLKS